MISAGGEVFLPPNCQAHFSSHDFSSSFATDVARQEPKEKLGQVKSRDKKNSSKVCTDTASLAPFCNLSQNFKVDSHQTLDVKLLLSMLKGKYL